MSRSTLDDVIDVLLMLPWWLNCLLAGISYAFLAYWVPNSEPAKPLLAGLYRIGPTFAPYVAGLFLIAAVVTGVKSFRRRKLYDSQTSIESIRAMSWQEFERFIGEGFRRKGYSVSEAEAGPDGGVDLRISKAGKLYLVQCKQWRDQRVGVKPARELAGVVSVECAAGGILVTSGRFTSEAREFAETAGIELVDGEDLLSRFGLVEQARVISATSNSPACPKCGRSMHRRVARRGERAGKPFWGCSGYPACRGIININGANGAVS